MKKIPFTFQIEAGADKASGDNAFREIFERGLQDAKSSVKAVAVFGFRGEYMAVCLAQSMKLLKAAGRQDSSDAVKMFTEAVDCIKSAQVQLQLEHDNNKAVLKDRFENVKYSGEKDPRFVCSMEELKRYSKDVSGKAMRILKTYDCLMDLLGTDPVWMDTYSNIIGLGSKFIEDVLNTFVINDKFSMAMQQDTQADDLIIKWRSRLEVVREEMRKVEERRRKEEEARRERERKEEEERLKKEAEERARKEAEEAAERIRREAEEAAERARKEAAERIAREQREAEEREKYEQLAAKLNGDIADIEKKKADIQAEYDALEASLGSKLADQEAELNLLNQLKMSQKEIEDELGVMRADRTDRMAKYTKLGVFAGAEKKNLKNEIDRLDIEIAGKESKLNSYKREVESVERRVQGKDNGARLRMKGMQQDMEKLDADIAAIRKRMIDEKPAHMA